MPEAAKEPGYEDLQKVLRWFTAGGRPLVGAAAGALPLGLLGYHLGPRLLFGALNRIPFAGGMASFAPEEYRRAQKRMGLLAALVGAAPGLFFTGMNISRKGLPGLWKKYSSMQKSGQNLGGPFGLAPGVQLVDYLGSKQTIRQDPFLPVPAKFQTSVIFDQALARATHGGKLQGLLTTSDLIKGAVGAGVGYTGAAVLGPLLGALFGLPSGLRARLSRTGALAGALLGSGIISGG